MDSDKPKRPKAAKSTRSSAPEKSTPAAPQKAAAAKSTKPAASPAKAPAAEAKAAPLKKTASAKSAPEATAAPTKAPKGKLKIPAILREGDRPAATGPSGPGSRYALGAETLPEQVQGGPELPEAYGTRRLLLTARDPHWLYAHWDFTNEQLKEANAASRDGHLVLRVFRREVSGKPAVEQHVHPESRNWFVHVSAAGARYVALLGYYDSAGQWQGISTSTPTLTPPDALSSDTSVRFETIPVDVPFQKLLQLVKSAVSEHVPLVEAIGQLRAEGFTQLPPAERVAGAAWTPEQERALAQVINIDSVRRVWMGSLEITELIRRKLEHEISSQAAAALARGEQLAAAEIGGVSSISSPFGGAEKRRGFWFNVNAELIIYGATEPDAIVTIGGRKIALRKDGTFSFRFALPDGQFQLPVAATSSDAVETRSADLSFRRATMYSGDVGAHPQDAALKPPRPEHVV